MKTISMRFTSGCFAILLLMLMAGSGAAESALKVQVDIYSGRPNPTFTITNPAVIQQLVADLSAAPRSQDDPTAVEKAVNRLGYRGVLVENADGIAGLPEVMRVFDGNVMIVDSLAGTFQLYDDSGKMERKLLRKAKNKGLITDLIAEGFIPNPRDM